MFKVEFKERVIEKDTVERLWKDYSRTFEEINKKAPYYQSLYYDDFKHVLWDPAFYKFLLLEEDQIIGLVIVAASFEKTGRWISTPFLRTQFADVVKEGRIFYVVTYFVLPEFQGKGSFKIFSDAVFNFLNERAGKKPFVFIADWAQELDSFFYEAAKHYWQGIIVDQRTLGHQVYEAFYFDLNKAGSKEGSK